MEDGLDEAAVLLLDEMLDVSEGADVTASIVPAIAC